MKLNQASLSEKDLWQGLKLPTFSLETVGENTDKATKWIHFGAGNIFRGFIAPVNHKKLSFFM